MKRYLQILAVLILVALLGYYFFPEQKIPEGVVIDRLVVTKSKRTLDVYANGEILKTYSICIGRNPVGHKQYEGDMRTPEGQYVINERNDKSDFHKNLGISYPNEADMRVAKSHGVNPGNAIKIHGLKNGFGFIGKFHRLFNRTAGCIAVTDEQIDELYAHVPDGTPILINP